MRDLCLIHERSGDQGLFLRPPHHPQQDPTKKRLQNEKKRQAHTQMRQSANLRSGSKKLRALLFRRFALPLMEFLGGGGGDGVVFSVPDGGTVDRAGGEGVANEERARSEKSTMKWSGDLVALKKLDGVP